MTQATTDPARQDYTVEELEQLSKAELLRLHGALKLAIGEIGGALVDRTRKPSPDADQEIWDEFKQWRRRARQALEHKKRTLVEIKLIMTERQFQVRMPSPRETEEERRERAARVAYLRATLDSQAPETLVLEGYRVIRHLLPDGAELPDELDTNDRLALAKLARFLRETFGRPTVKAFIADPASTLKGTDPHAHAADPS